jgi:hypothetical protein
MGGQQIFQDRGFDWSSWLAKQWDHLVLLEKAA